MAATVITAVVITAIILAIGVLTVNFYLPAEKKAGRQESPLVLKLRRWFKSLNQTERIIFYSSIIGGLVLATVTAWLPYLIITVAAGVILPRLFSTQADRLQMHRLEDLEAWTRSLCGLISTGTSLERAIAHSRANAGETIHASVQRVVARIDAGWTTRRALKGLADELDDSTGDLIVMNLMLAAKQRGAGLLDSLNEVANTVQEEISIRNKIAADRAAIRWNVRIVVIVTSGMVFALPFIPALQASYNTPMGQLIYLGGIAVMSVILLSMYRLSQPTQQSRLIAEVAP